MMRRCRSCHRWRLPTLHAKGTELIRTHERLIAALEQIAAIPDNVSSSPSATRIAQEALNART